MLGGAERVVQISYLADGQDGGGGQAPRQGGSSPVGWIVPLGIGWLALRSV